MVLKKQPKKKQNKVGSIKRKAWKLFSEYIRLRDCLKTTGLKDYGKCITCGRIVPRKLLQAGHFIPGRHNANLFSEKGTHAQCYNCNINLRGNTLEYRRKIIEMYGAGYDEILEAEDRKVVKYTQQDYNEFIDTLKEKIKEIEDA